MTMREIITKKYILSEAYEEIMLKYIREGENFYNLAEWTPNFVHRQKNLSELGPWRWMAVFQNREFIAEYIFSDLEGIDFGGNKGTIGGNTDIVDKYPIGKYPQLNAWSYDSLDYIFSSHTLEHVENYRTILYEMYCILRYGGKLILVLPSYKLERWIAGKGGNSHIHTFSLDENYTNVADEVNAAGFDIITAEYAWDNSIFIIAEKCL